MKRFFTDDLFFGRDGILYIYGVKNGQSEIEDGIKRGYHEIGINADGEGDRLCGLYLRYCRRFLRR